MITVNPVHFLNVERGKRYIPNPQYISTAKGVPAQLANRVGCVLAANHLKMSQIPGNSILTFKCINIKHTARFCAGISPLKLTRTMFQTPLSSEGNILIEIYNERCHACGEQRSNCWREFTGHYVCGSCIILGRGSAPYVYGKTKNKCCVVNKCGQGMGLFSESGHMLFSKAIAIYERYNNYDV